MVYPVLFFPLQRLSESVLNSCPQPNLLKNQIWILGSSKGELWFENKQFYIHDKELFGTIQVFFFLWGLMSLPDPQRCALLNTGNTSPSIFLPKKIHLFSQWSTWGSRTGLLAAPTSTWPAVWSSSHARPPGTVPAKMLFWIFVETNFSENCGRWKKNSKRMPFGAHLVKYHGILSKNNYDIC